jgi:hypothetical protein
MFNGKEEASGDITFNVQFADDQRREPLQPHDGGVWSARLISWISAQNPHLAQPRFRVWSEKPRTAQLPN